MRCPSKRYPIHGYGVVDVRHDIALLSMLGHYSSLDDAQSLHMRQTTSCTN